MRLLAAVKDEHFDRERAALPYAEAFRVNGLDGDQLDPHEAAARIEVSAVREQLETPFRIGASTKRSSRGRRSQTEFGNEE
jgi:hypothetical protein